LDFGPTYSDSWLTILLLGLVASFFGNPQFRLSSLLLPLSPIRGSDAIAQMDPEELVQYAELGISLGEASKKHAEIIRDSARQAEL
jgi:hypothetical protein